MQLYAALVPPTDLVTDVLDTVRAVPFPEPSGPAEQPARRSLFSRRANARSAAATPLLDPPVELTGLADVGVPLTGFGNVTTNDAHRIAQALRPACRALGRTIVHLTGCVPLAPPEETLLAVELREPPGLGAVPGAVHPLRTISSTVVRSVEQVGFFCDRRAFRPHVPLGEVTAAATPTYLHRVGVALDAHLSEAWEVTHVSVLRRTGEGAATEFEEIDQVPVGHG